MRDENSAVSTETLASPRELSIDEAEMVSGGFHWHFNLGRFDHAVGSGMIDGAVGGAVGPELSAARAWARCQARCLGPSAPG